MNKSKYSCSNILVFIFVVVLGAKAAAAQKGTVGGGGLDSRQIYEGTTWFLGRDKIVKTCFQKDVLFSVSDKDVSDAIELAVKSWKDYYRLILQERLNQQNHVVSPRDFSPSFRFQVFASCQGDEDLKLYLGSRTREIDAEKLRYNNPLSFVSRTQFDEESGWSRGYIWVSDELVRIPGFSLVSLKAVLMHEFGHIFGVSHVPGTIMDEDFAGWVRFPTRYYTGDDRPPRYQSPPIEIDQSQQLYPHDGSVQGLIAKSFCTIFLQVECGSGYGELAIAKLDGTTMQLTFSIDTKDYQMEIEEIQDVKEEESELLGAGGIEWQNFPKIFNSIKIGHVSSSGEWQGFRFNQFREEFEGGLTKTQSGILNISPTRWIPVTIYRNPKGGWIRIDYVHEGTRRTFFADTSTSRVSP